MNQVKIEFIFIAYKLCPSSVIIFKEEIIMEYFLNSFKLTALFISEFTSVPGLMAR